MLVLTGPSGSGKDTVANILATDYGYARLLMHMTRPKRPTEVEGVNGYFVDNETFNEIVKANKFAVVQEFPFYINDEQTTVYYGLLNNENLKELKSVFIISIDGIEELRSYCIAHSIPIYVIGLYADETELRERLGKRGDEYKEIEKRIGSDNEKYHNMDDICDAVLDSSTYCVSMMADQINDLYPYKKD